MQHAAVYVLWRALDECLVEQIVATVAQAGALQVLLIAVHRVVARGPPQDAALVGMGATSAQEAVRLIPITGLRVATEHVRWAILRLAGAELG